MARRQVLVALAVALFTSVLTYAYIASMTESEEVIIASCDIPAGSRLSPQSVRLVPLPKRSVHQSAFRRKEDVVGRFAIQPIIAGEQVLKSRVAVGEHAGVTSGLAQDLRAMFVPVQDSKAVGGAVRAGDRVDVIFVSQEHKMGAAVARCVLRSVLVIAAGSGGAGSWGPSQRTSFSGPDYRAEGVLVAVTPQDAERLAFCLENGQVYLATVPFGAATVDTRGTTWSNLFDDGTR